jgi:hypothetical protein
MTKQIADEAMGLWNAAFKAYLSGSTEKSAYEAASAVITAKLAEKDAEIARLRVGLERIERIYPSWSSERLAFIKAIVRQTLNPERPYHER